MSSPSDSASAKTKVVVATTVALSFITLWRAAAIVLSDLASTMFYVGGIAERAIGKSAPWMILCVLLFGFAIRWVYLESCGMFVRGGVYVVVRNSMGPTMAKLSVSALVVDYLLTGPISSVSAGQYIAGLLNDVGEWLHLGLTVEPRLFSVLFAISVTVYFWWSNVKGIHESSSKALRILQITTVMVVILLIWCPLTILLRGGAALPPPPVPENLKLDEHSLGWLHGTFLVELAPVLILIAFGHSLLAMSGFETLAQVYREIAYPKMKNLRTTALIVCTYALVATGLTTMFAVMIIPDETRSRYWDNLIGGLSMNLAGPEWLRLIFHAFVVLVGGLILSGAVNTSLIGANGVLNRVAEDGVLLDWFRRPHQRFGTSYRIINLLTALQLATILASRGNVNLLGEAYAFGVVWSFFMKGLGVLVLRFQRGDQDYKTPLNVRIGRTEIPVGLALTTFVLFSVAVANLLTKQIATIYGVSFTLLMFILFEVSERTNVRKRPVAKAGLEEFNLEHWEGVTPEALEAKPGCVLVSIRDYTRMHHLEKALEKAKPRRHDIVVMTVRPVKGAEGEHDLAKEQFFGDYEKELFTHVVQKAEKMGKTVSLLTVPATDPFDAMVRTASDLQAARLVTGVSPRMPSEELARRIGLAWEKLPEPRHAFSLEVVTLDGQSNYVNLGPHPPRLWPDDVDLLHRLWLELADEQNVGSRLHHRDVVGLALRRLKSDLSSEEREQVLNDLFRVMNKS